MNSIEKINKILSNRQILYLLLIAVVLGIMLHPLGIPIGIAGQTRDVYNYVDKLPQNPKILMDVHYDPAGATELQPMAGAFLRQVITKSPKIVFFTTHNVGPIMFERLKGYFPDVFSQLKYGDDYVNLGFLPLAEATFASIAKGAQEFVAKDVYGASTADMPIFKVADKAADFNVVVLITTSTDPVEYAIRQWYTAYKMPLLFMVVAVIGPSVQPFVASAQAVGMLSGQNAAAQYELLLKKPGSAVAAVDAQSGAHVLIMIYIVLGNLIYWPMRRMSKKAGGKTK
ncbi:MAG: hypothetical protein ABSF09_09515 [Candidatus Bathyarchaeia archaeon]|jgi:hypothetical protein